MPPNRFVRYVCVFRPSPAFRTIRLSVLREITVSRETIAQNGSAAVKQRRKGLQPVFFAISHQFLVVFNEICNFPVFLQHLGVCVVSRWFSACVPVSSPPLSPTQSQAEPDRGRGRPTDRHTDQTRVREKEKEKEKERERESADWMACWLAGWLAGWLVCA